MLLSFADIIELLVVDEWNMCMKYGQADTERRKPKYLEKTCPSATLYAANSTSTGHVSRAWGGIVVKALRY